MNKQEFKKARHEHRKSLRVAFFSGRDAFKKAYVKSSPVMRNCEPVVGVWPISRKIFLFKLERLNQDYCFKTGRYI